MKGLGSVIARNILLDMVTKHNIKFAVMADDDYLLPDEKCLTIMARNLELNKKVGAVGGKLIISQLRMDPDFFLNLPFNFSDFLSKLTGYIFLDIKHGPRYSDFLPPFFINMFSLKEGP